jgi:hypothetical protein
MTGTLVNVATGAGLKIAGYILGRIVDGYFENRRLELQALNDKADRIARLNSGNDTADDFTKWTRRVLAWSFGFTACFILAYFAIDANSHAIFLIDKSNGIFGWIVGGTNQTTVTISKAQMIMNMWPLLEILFGFYFTKVGK